MFTIWHTKNCFNESKIKCVEEIKVTLTVRKYIRRVSAYVGNVWLYVSLYLGNVWLYVSEYVGYVCLYVSAYVGNVWLNVSTRRLRFTVRKNICLRFTVRKCVRRLRFTVRKYILRVSSYVGYLLPYLIHT